MTLPFTLRPSQTEILRYRGGKLGISAVPGSGKTFTLSALAAQIISSGAVEHAYLGVGVASLSESVASELGVPAGAMVTEVRQGTPAAA